MVEGRELEIARERRRALHEAMVEIDEAVSAPGAADDWHPDLEQALRVLEDAFAAHVADTEAREGIIESMIERAPHLADRIEALRQDHDRLASLLASLGTVIESLGAPPTGDDVATARAEVLRVLGALAVHRQAGADLVYESYGMDIGGG